ncbi:helix-turn-helix domain containing protein [Streptomyces sp. ME01-24h]|nr:helix-turn-helix domain containing protein [Streptomyces sp. ME19-03-3]MDX3352569.1 helix-turn-helix domain containing protein [Streptomyces sp. ME01-24h]
MTPSVQDGGAREDYGTRGGGLRADAVRNRRRIRTAAADLLAEQGAGVSLDRIARLAGVSNATLYRHYGSRAELLTDVAEGIAAVAAGAEARLATSDPLVALRGFLTSLASVRPAALYCLPEGPGDDPAGDAGPRARVLAATRRLLLRAQRAGRVRDEVTAEDVLAVVSQFGRPLPGATWRATEERCPRLVRQYVDGLVAAALRVPHEPYHLPRG